MRKKYIVIQITENNKFYAYVIPTTQSDNLISKLTIKGIIFATIANTKKEAYALADMWNDGFKQNNMFLYDEPLF